MPLWGVIQLLNHPGLCPGLIDLTPLGYLGQETISREEEIILIGVLFIPPDWFNVFGGSCTEYYKEGRGDYEFCFCPDGAWILLLYHPGRCPGLIDLTPSGYLGQETISREEGIILIGVLFIIPNRFNVFGVSCTENYKEERKSVLKGLYPSAQWIQTLRVSWAENDKEGRGICPERTLSISPGQRPGLNRKRTTPHRGKSKIIWYGTILM